MAERPGALRRFLNASAKVARTALWEEIPGSGVVRAIYDQARVELTREHLEEIERLRAELEDQKRTISILLEALEQRKARIAGLEDELATFRSGPGAS